ncbi:hypothetical protein [Legionella septentrionalis]|uniref:hypothetical protein n=1 Tax=Legionella septentrionalis TaxID=2498109 RepID=UPI000F8DAA65|nr:hypothetical protein [Legionella septentrionalis]RUQ97460.1 hypothetical protein ELY11_06305 [Legionella septentrionalis]
MRIILDRQRLEMDSISQLINFIQENETKDFSAELCLKIEDANVNPEEFYNLLACLNQPEIKTAYLISFDGQYAEYNELLFDAYLAAKRRQFATNHPMIILAEGNTIPEEKIRKTKMDLSRQAHGIALQIQQQQQQHLKNEQHKKAAKRQVKRNEEIQSSPQISIHSSELGECIDLNNIAEKLAEYANNLYPNIDLKKIWKDLVGEGADKIGDFSQKITSVQRGAMEKIILHHSEFVDGIVLQKPPLGFYMQKTSDGEHVLCYKNSELENTDPLSLSLSNKPTYANGTAKQFILTLLSRSTFEEKAQGTFVKAALNGEGEAFKKEFPHSEEYQKYFEQLTNGNEIDGIKNAFLFFLKELATPAGFKDISQKLDAFNFTAEQYHGLAKMLLHNGENGVFCFLGKLTLLNKKGLYKHFHEIFLDNGANFEAFLSEESLSNLDKLINFDPAAQSWWETLTTQHAKSGARLDFNELITAFDYFRAQLKLMGLSLPIVCPLQKVKHLKTTLIRVLDIIHNAGDGIEDKREQLRLLNNLDFSVNGAHLASCFAHYKCVSEEMQFLSSEENLNYAAPTSQDLLQSTQSGDAAKRKKIFYRYVGAADYAFSFVNYESIFKLIESTEFPAQAKIKLQAFAARITTGERAYREINNPIREMQELLHLVNSFQFNAQELDALLYSALKFSVVLPTEKMLTPYEWGKVFEFIHSTAHSGEKLESFEVFQQCFIKFNEFNHILINNYKERVVKEENQVISYKKLGSLFLSLNDIAKEIKDFSSFVILVSCIKDIDPVDNESNIESIQQFKKNLLLLPESLQNIFLDFVKDINVKKSTSLPTFGELNNVLVQIKSQQAIFLQKSEMNCKEEMVEFITKSLPNVSFGAGPLLESTLDLVGVIKHFFEKVNLTDQIDKYLNKTPQLLLKLINPQINKILTPLKELQEYLNNNGDEAPTMEGMAAKFKAIDEGFAEILRIKLPFTTPIDVFKGFIPKIKESVLESERTDIGFNEQASKQKLDRMFNEFVEERPSLLTFLKYPIKESFVAELTSSVARLQTGNDKLQNILVKILGDIDLNLGFVDALKNYDDRFKVIVKFINTLVRINNQCSGPDYAAVVKLISEINLENFDLNDMAQLLEQLTEQSVKTNTSVSVQLAIILNVLKKHPNYSNKNWTSAISQIGILAKYPNLSSETYLRLLGVSFVHNLTKENFFPLAELLELHSSKEIEKTEAELVFASLVEVLGSTEEGTEELIISFIKNTIALIKECNASNPELVSVIALLLKQCDGTLSQLNIYLKLLHNFPGNNAEQFNIWLQIFRGIIETNHHAIRLQDLLAVQDGLRRHEESLDIIKTLFASLPYPNLSWFLRQLELDAQQLKDNIRLFDWDPKQGRVTKNALKEQFSTQRVHQVVSEVKRLLNGTNLANDEQYDLEQQINYINAIGCDVPLTIDGLSCKNLTKASRAELKTLSERLIGNIKSQHLNPQEMRKSMLQLIAVMRETFFRTTGKFPYTDTQLLALLLSIENPGHLLMQLETGEGKALIMAMLNVLRWVRGGSVIVCTANHGLIQQDYYEKGIKNFYQALGIPSTVVYADSPKNTFIVGGINYTTIADASLYEARAHQEGEKLFELEDGTSVPAHLHLDESDLILDNRTLFNYAIDAEGQDEGLGNAYAWIYPLINDFIDADEFLNVDFSNGDVWDNNFDLVKLNIHLLSKNLTRSQAEQLEHISEKKLNRWINAACKAKSIYMKWEKTQEHTATPGIKNDEIKVPFLIKDEQIVAENIQKKLAAAVPLINNEPQKGMFKGSVHQFLHARLRQHDTEDRVWVIDPEMRIVASESSSGFVKRHQKVPGSVVLGISATLGTEAELLFQKSKFGMDAFSIPPHQTNKRETLNVQLAKDFTDQITQIKEAINQVIPNRKEKNTQPILLVCKDMNHAELLHKELHSYFALESCVLAKMSSNPLTHSFEDVVNFLGLGNKPAVILFGEELYFVDHESQCIEHVYISDDKKREFTALKEEFQDNPKDAAARQLKLITSLTGRGFVVNLITGKETLDNGQSLIAEAAQANRITVATSAKGRGTDIEVEHEEGLYTIQCYLDTERTTRQVKGRSARNSKKGKFLSIINVEGIAHRYDSKKLLELSLPERKKALRFIQKQINEEIAVERHYTQEVDAIQQLLLEQFDDWVGFFKKITPENEFKSLAKDLLPYREEIITNIDDFWETCLEETDKEKKYVNPFVRRNDAGNLEKNVLEEALQQLLGKASEFWKKTVLELKGKAQKNLKENSVDEIRALYMSQVDIAEQYKLNKHTARKERKEAKSEQLNSARRAHYAMDVDAAVLRFEPAIEDKEARQIKSLHTQFKLLKQDFERVAQKLPFKAPKIHDLLKQLPELAFKFNAYNKEKDTLPAFMGIFSTDGTVASINEIFKGFATAFQSYEKRAGSLLIKFQMQPVVLDFIELFNQAKNWLGVRELPEVEELKESFIDSVADQIIDDLDKTLSWAKPEERGIGYRLERSAVKQAAQDLLAIVAAYKQIDSQDREKRLLQIKELHKILYIHEHKLKDLWLFSFGHKSTRYLINTTLKSLDILTKVSDDIDASFKKDNREHAMRALGLENFEKLLGYCNQEVEKNFAKHAESLDLWHELVREIRLVKENNPSIYVFREIRNFITRFNEKNNEQLQASKLREPIQKILNGIRKEAIQAENNYSDLFASSSYLEIKEKQLLEKIPVIAGNNVQELTLRKGHTGFCEYLDLTIKKQAQEPIKGFEQYGQQTEELEQKQSGLRAKKLINLNIQTGLQTSIEHTQTSDGNKLSLEYLWPANLQSTVNSINSLIDYSEHENTLDSLGKQMDSLSEYLRSLLQQHNILQCDFADINTHTLSMLSGFDKRFNAYEELIKTKEKLKDEIEVLQKKIKLKESKKNQSIATVNHTPATRVTSNVFKKVQGAFAQIGEKLQSAFSESLTSLKEQKKEKEHGLNRLEQWFNKNRLQQFEELKIEVKKKLNQEAQSALKQEINEKKHELIEAIQAINKDYEAENHNLDTLIREIDNKIMAEKNKSRIAIKRFNNLEELWDFEASLREQNTPEPSPSSARDEMIELAPLQTEYLSPSPANTI